MSRLGCLPRGVRRGSGLSTVRTDFWGKYQESSTLKIPAETCKARSPRAKVSGGSARGQAARVGAAGWGREASNHQWRARARRLRAAPAAAAAGAEPGRRSRSAAHGRAARASRRARPADHERPLLREQQPRREARGAERLSPCGRHGRRAPRGEVSPLRAPRGCCASWGAAPPGRTGWEGRWESSGSRENSRRPHLTPLPTPGCAGVRGRRGRSGDGTGALGGSEPAGIRQVARGGRRASPLLALLGRFSGRWGQALPGCSASRPSPPRPVPLCPEAGGGQGTRRLGAPLGAPARRRRVSQLISWKVCKESEGARRVTADNLSLPRSLC